MAPCRFSIPATFLLALLITPPGRSFAREGYWQQHVRYEIRASLDTRDHTLTGQETLVYANDSPDTLQEAYFHAYPNAFKDERSLFARESVRHGAGRSLLPSKGERGYIEFHTLECRGRPASWSYKSGDESEVRVELPQPILPGDSADFKIDFFVKLPAIVYRLGHTGDHYEISQWYPKIVVYDDQGWHPDGYHYDGEFYGDFGTFDVWITLPSNYTVAASGILLEPAAEIARLDSLAAMTRRITTRPSGVTGKELEDFESAARTDLPLTKTVHFRAARVHDFAWFADRRFLLLNDQYKDVRIHVYVLPEHRSSWKDVPRYVYDTLDWYGQRFGQYPYPQMSVADGSMSGGGGMEYPNVTVISESSPSVFRTLENAVVHETGHQWFYGLLGSNEMDQAWLDEGFNTFATARFFEEKHGLEKNLMNWPSRLRWLPGIDMRWLGLCAYHVLADADREEPILQPAYRFEDSYAGMVFAKGGWVVLSLQAILGDSVFNQVMRTYATEWSYKHPRVTDFAEVAQRVSGLNLAPFFEDYLTTTRKCDYAVGEIRTEPDRAGLRVEVHVQRKGDVRLPSVPVRLATQDGSFLDQRFDGQAERQTLVFHAKADPAWVEVDPRREILEIDHWNNRWPRANRWIWVGDKPSFYEIDTSFMPTAWYEDDADHWQLGFRISRGNAIVRRPLSRLYLFYALGSGRLGYRAGWKTRIPLNKHRTFVEVSGRDAEGYDQQRVTLTSRFRTHLSSRRVVDLAAAVFRNELYNLDYWEPQDWQTGRTIGAEARLGVQTRCPKGSFGHLLLVRQAVRVAERGPHYTRISGIIRTSRELAPGIRAIQSLFVGGIWGSPALQDRIYLAGELDPDRQDSWILDRRGSRFVPLERWYTPGGPALRGYYGAYLRGLHPAGRTGVGLNLEAEMGRLPLMPVLFYDTGNVWRDWNATRLDRLRGDAGLRLNLGPMALVFPFWLSHPSKGDAHWRFRWLFGLERLRIPAMDG